LSKGFDNLEIITFEEEFRRGFDEHLKTLLKYKDTVKYDSVHAPSNLTVAHVSDDMHRKFAEHCLETLIKMAPKIDCERVVFHGFYHATEISDAVEVASLRKKAFLRCVESVKRLERIARDLGVKMCLENINACIYLDRLYHLIFTASPYDLVEIAEEVSSEFFKFCFDPAHANNFCNFIHRSQEMRALYGVPELSIEEFFRTISDKVHIIHLSDAKGNIAELKTEHLPLGEGEIDFVKLFREIVKARFDGPIVLETQEIDVHNALNMVAGRKYLNEILGKIRDDSKNCSPSL
jgi:sugar phosphate isomerase/epimerase